MKSSSRPLISGGYVCYFFSDGERRPRRAQVGMCRRLEFDTQRPVDAPPLAGKERRGDTDWPPHGFRGRGRCRSCRGASVRSFGVLFQVFIFIVTNNNEFPSRALRNLCIDGGYEICAEMYNKNILAPLATFIPKVSARSGTPLCADLALLLDLLGSITIRRLSEDIA